MEVLSCHVEPGCGTRTGLEHALSSWKAPWHAGEFLHAWRAEAAALCGDTAAGLGLLQVPESLLLVPEYTSSPKSQSSTDAIPEVKLHYSNIRGKNPPFPPPLPQKNHLTLNLKVANIGQAAHFLHCFIPVPAPNASEIAPGAVLQTHRPPESPC